MKFGQMFAELVFLVMMLVKPRGLNLVSRPYVPGVKVARPRAKLNRGLLWIGRSRAPRLSEGEP